MERIGEERMDNGVYRTDVEGNKGKERLQRRWREEGTELLMGKRLREKERLLSVRNRVTWFI